MHPHEVSPRCTAETNKTSPIPETQYRHHARMWQAWKESPAVTNRGDPSLYGRDTALKLGMTHWVRGIWSKLAASLALTATGQNLQARSGERPL